MLSARRLPLPEGWIRYVSDGSSRTPGSVGDRGGGLGFEEFPFVETLRLL
ncbi:hypothetical protein [Microcoleus vaginatus]